MEGERILRWATRWLRPEDVDRIVAPTIADWRHEVAAAPIGARGATRRRGLRATLGAIARVVAGERLALARAAPWVLMALPTIAVLAGFAASGSSAPLLFLGLGALIFALVATTPARWIGPAWAWTGVGLLALTLLVGDAHEGATRWLTLGPLRVQVTMLALPLVLLGGRAPAAVAAGLLAAAPDALGATALAVAAPHPIVLVASIVGWLREPAMTIDAQTSGLALASITIVAAGVWRFRSLPEGRLVLALVALGLGAHLAGHAPMPLVGPGGSAIVAVCLALALVPARQSWTRTAPVG
ncbi:MAG: hypothetical protein IT385_00475 [Deltaproteobacteria bacterium]|nr:hypothetical protein [Deltaproteobacteria bacterium]